MLQKTLKCVSLTTNSLCLFLFCSYFLFIFVFQCIVLCTGIYVLCINVFMYTAFCASLCAIRSKPHSTLHVLNKGLRTNVVFFSFSCVPCALCETVCTFFVTAEICLYVCLFI